MKKHKFRRKGVLQNPCFCNKYEYKIILYPRVVPQRNMVVKTRKSKHNHPKRLLHRVNLLVEFRRILYSNMKKNKV